jgi:hypothetical protein
VFGAHFFNVLTHRERDGIIGISFLYLTCDPTLDHDSRPPTGHKVGHTHQTFFFLFFL